MIDLYWSPTPNGHKITMLLEETGTPFRLIPVDISAGDQFRPEFLAISPNNKIPAIVDHAPADGDEPIALFESGAILLYLAEKLGRFLPVDPRGRKTVLEWLFWQVGGVGPMAGQNHHFVLYAPEPIPYAIDRYVSETRRLYAVLDRRLADRPFIAGDYSIADIACYPWVANHARQRQDLTAMPHLSAWLERIAVRPATARAYALAEPFRHRPVVTEAGKAVLFGQRDVGRRP